MSEERTTPLYARILIGCAALMVGLVVILGGIALSSNASGSPEGGSTGPALAYYFSYTGDVEQILLQTGTYTLEAWGGRGSAGGSGGSGGSGGGGGLGGYARATLMLTSPAVLYILVGGDSAGAAGGFNGGGNGGSSGVTGGGGGGATHISKAVGFLKESAVRENILLAAGGGGGGGGGASYSSSGHGGVGGVGNGGASTDGKGGTSGITGGGGTGGGEGTTILGGEGGTGGRGGNDIASAMGNSGNNGNVSDGGSGGDAKVNGITYTGSGGGGGGGWFGGGGGGSGGIGYNGTYYYGGGGGGGGGGGSGFVGAACRDGVLFLYGDSGYERRPESVKSVSNGFVRITSGFQPYLEAAPIYAPSSSNGTEFSYNAETQGPILAASSAYTITGTTSAIGAGDYAVTATLNDPETKWADGTTEPKTIEWSIARAKLIVRADNKAKQFGETDPPLTWNITGFKGNDNESVITGSFNISTTATQSSPVGTYPITIGGDVEADNYYFDFIDGTLTISEAPPVYHDVTFDANGGALGEGTTNQSILNGSWASAPINNPTRTGYYFAGWFTSQQDGEEYDFYSEVTSELTLWAQWIAKYYTVVYHFNGGSHLIDVGFARFGDALDLVVPVRDLHSFDGWFSMDEETQYTDSEGKSTTAWNEDPDGGEIHMLAKWTKIGFIISFVTNTTEDTISAEIVYAHTNMVNVIKRNPVRKGYNFDGWFKETDLKNEFKFDVEEPPVTDITLYAGWTAKKYTVIYNSNGGTYDQEKGTVTWGETYTLAVPKLNHYYFMGWFDFEGRQFTNTAGKSDTYTWDVDINNFDLYAHWETAKYEMRFDFADGRPWITVTHPYNEKIPASLIPADPTREFGSFQGWFTPEGVKFDFETMGMPANGVSLTARWEVDMTKLRLLVSELQGYIDFDGFEPNSYKIFIDALNDSTSVISSVDPQTIERVEQSYDDLLAAAIELTIADSTGKVIPPEEFRPPNTSNTWVFVLLGCIVLIIAAALVVWFILMKRQEKEEKEASA